MEPLVECVPNFSEGRDPEKIEKIANCFRSVKGIHLLDIDPGFSANRTVFTLIGSPESVIEASYQCIKLAGDLIDMRSQKGVHPRIGSCDVFPFIPLRGISRKEMVIRVKDLGEKLGRDLGLPIFLYEDAQKNTWRKQLSQIRSGEYEGLEAKMQIPKWKPDFGPTFWDEKRGATVIGVRSFLIAFNVNLATSQVALAQKIALEIRESGGTYQDEKGNLISVQGGLKSVRAMGWYIEEYRMAQVSMNLTQIQITPLHVAYEEVKKKAKALGIQVLGSELIGLVPLAALTEAGKYYQTQETPFLRRKETDLIQLAVDKLGLNSLKPFIAKERILEYRLV